MSTLKLGSIKPKGPEYYLRMMQPMACYIVIDGKAIAIGCATRARALRSTLREREYRLTRV
jgi:hypothetical protein